MQSTEVLGSPAPPGEVRDFLFCELAVPKLLPSNLRCIAIREPVAPEMVSEDGLQRLTTRSLRSLASRSESEYDCCCHGFAGVNHLRLPFRQRQGAPAGEAVSLGRSLPSKRCEAERFPRCAQILECVGLRAADVP